MRKLLILCFFLPLISWGQSSLPPCPETGVKHNCFGVTAVDGGGTYIGEYQYDSWHGQGVFIYGDHGTRYAGGWLKGKPAGRGVLFFPDGSRRVGEWSVVKPTEYEGIEYKDSGAVIRSGRWRGNDLVRAYFVDSKRYPFNQTAEGQRQGNFKSPVSTDPGTDQKAQNQLYPGSTHSSLLPSCTDSISKDNCFGASTLPNQNQYVGEWNKNQPNGLGISYSKSGAIVKAGRWANGEFSERLSLDKSNFPFLPLPRVYNHKSDSYLFNFEGNWIEATHTATNPATGDKAFLVGNEWRVVRKPDLEMDRESAELKTERRKRRELESQLAEAKAAAEIARIRAEADALKKQQPVPVLNYAAVQDAHALVIGNSAYPGSNRLANPTNDAKAMTAKLRSLGFKVTEISNATREQMVRGLSEFSKTASRADLTLLFYAGHGVQIAGTNYMIPIDMSLNDASQATLQAVSLNSVVEQYLPGKTKLVFLDACRDNPLMASVGRGVTKGLAPINVSQGTLIAYATKDGQTADDGVGSKNSPFTSALLEHLGDPDDIAVVLRTVRAKVMERTNNRQQPWEYGSLTGGALVLSAIKR